MYSQDDLLPVNRNYYIIGGCAVLIFSVIIIGIVISTISTNDKSINNISISKDINTPSADLTKYNQDSDLDRIPNFVEQELILNTYIAETDYCQNKFPTCNNSPIEKPMYVSILVSASTSMNIPAVGTKLKYQLIEEELSKNLISNLNNSYMQTQISSFGNNGSLSGIAANESCVANFVLKKFDEVIPERNNNEVINSLFEKYVPNGKSPLVYTIEQAEKNFPDKTANNLIQVITDGLDDCNGDLKSALTAVKARGVVKRIDLITIFANQDTSNLLKEAVEVNGGKYSASTNIDQTLQQNYVSFINERWCKTQTFNTIYQCVNENYTKAIDYMNDNLSIQTPKNEVEKIKEIQGSINVLIQNFRNNNDQKLKEELDNFLTPKRN
jgi:hypothetical protein